MSRANLFFLLGVVLAVGACAQTPDSGAAPSELVVGIEGNPTILDPRVALDAYAERIFPLIFEGLFQLDQNSEPQPWLVSSYEQPDALTYIFHLKSGHFCPDGTELTAEDVIYNLNSLGDPVLGSRRKTISDKIAELTALDKYTVRLRLKEPFAPFLTELAFGLLPASAVKKAEEEFLKKAMAETSKLEGPAREKAETEARKKALTEFARRPFGSGPYQVESFEPGSAVRLIVNPRFHGRRPSFSRLTFRIIPDDVTRVLALERGEVSLLLNSTPPDDVPLVMKNPRLKVVMQPGINYVYLGINLRDPILQDLRVRKALAHAIDRESLIHCLLRDTVTPATGLLAPSHWAYSAEVAHYDYDPEKAKALLDEAGFPDPDGEGPLPRFRLLYKTSQLKTGRWIAEAIQGQLKKVGIEIQVRSYEWGTYFADIISGNFQLYSLTWVGTADPDLYYSIFHSSSLPPNGYNRNHYSNPELDRLVEEGRRTLDPKARRLIYTQVQDLLSRDLPCLSLWHNKSIVVSDRRLQGFVIYPSGDFRSLAEARWEE